MDKETEPRKPVVLFVEDDIDDIFLCRTAFEREKLDAEVCMVSTVREAIDWLAGLPPFNNREFFPVPTIVVSDLKTPEMNGMDLLQWVHTTVAYMQLPIIIHSGTLLPGDLGECMKLGAKACIVKEPLCRNLVESIKRAIARG